MQTIMDITLDTQAKCNDWYSSKEPIATGQITTPVLSSIITGVPSAEVRFNPSEAGHCLWWDANHVHFGFINLLCVSWFGAPVADPWGAARGKAWPGVADLSGAEIIFTAWAYDLYLPGTARLGLWLQARIPDVSPQGNVEWVWANYFQHADLLDDVLGFGGRGMERPKTTWGVRNSGWRDWRIRLSPDDSMWTAMGSRLSKTSISGQPQGQFAYGAAASVKDILAAPVKANMGIIAAWAPTPDLNTPPYPTCPMLGRIFINRVRLLVPD